MSWTRRVLQLLLNPRARLDALSPVNVSGSTEIDPGAPAGKRGRRNRLKSLLNLPFVFGGIILIGLFLVVLFGPTWAPHNPYIAGRRIVPHFDRELDEWISPPLSPSAKYPLGTDEYGNDIFSMLLYGARNTLVAAAFITMARIILGLILGATAGWHEGKLVDRTIMGAVGVIAAVPVLISSMISIFALDIRRGLPVFIVALTLLGWTEIAQYIRGEFLVLRKRPYIEGARSVGAHNRAIATRHVLPNLLPKLLVITFLEVAAVLMLFGELGFVGVFIGGGSHISIGDETIGTEVLNLSEVPEWGAMLSEGYRWLRAKPFIVFPPAMAFFIAVIGFTAFGEGLRQYIEKHHVNTNFLLKKRMLLVIAGMTMATVFIINNTGPAPWFAKVARAFDADSAYAHTKALAEMGGRGQSQAGGQQAAIYITDKFEAYGLQPGWRHSEYAYPLETKIVYPSAQPQLTLVGNDIVSERSYQHQIDFGFVIEDHGGSGTVEQPVTFVAFSKDSDQYNWQSYRGLDLRDRIVMVVEGNSPAGFATEALIRGAEGVLIVVNDTPGAVRSQIQLAYEDQRYLQNPTIPIYRIKLAVAQDITGQAGVSLNELLTGRMMASQTGSGWSTHDLSSRVNMSVALSEPQSSSNPAILGFLKGSDFQLANDLIVLFATYDGLGTDPDGSVFTGANHNAAGIGIMLELARLWQEQELDPRRSVMFVAWGGGELDNPGVGDFLADRASFRHLPAQNSGRSLAPTMVVQLDHVGAGGDRLIIHPDSDDRLAQLLQDSRDGAGVDVVTQSEGLLPVINDFKAPRAAWLSFAWEQGDSPPHEDSMARIEAKKLQVVGKMLSHMLTQVVRQSSF